MLAGRELISITCGRNSVPKGPGILKQEETFQELQGPAVGEAEEMEITLSRTFIDQISHCVSILRVMEARENQACTSEWGCHLLS